MKIELHSQWCGRSRVKKKNHVKPMFADQCLHKANPK
jgi:hypothetical protein